MSLAALPSELLYAISNRIAPDTIEAYGQTCRRIRLIAAPLITEHRQLLARYTTASLDNAKAVELLYAIASRPWIKFYPKSLELVADKDRQSLEKPRTPRQRSMRAQLDVQRASVDESDVTDLIKGTGLLQPHEQDEWVRALHNANEDFTFGLLIAILPNVNRLAIHCDRNKLENMKEMLRRIKKQGGGTRALAELKTIRVLEQGRADGCDLEIFPMFAALPGITNIYGRNLVGMYRECYRDGWMSYPGASSSITHISLETCGMSVEGLEMLMKSLRNLQSFKYTAHRAGWGLHAIADLLKEARSTLQTLEISTGSGSSRYVGSLRQFVALKNLTLDTDMIMRMGKIQRAVDILPSSIERVTLCGNNLTEPQEERFLADLYRPAFTYPCLKSIGVEGSYGRRQIGKERLKFQKEFHKQTSSSWMLRY